MFEIPVWDLLASFSWDSRELEFNGEVLPWFYLDLDFIWPLRLKLKLITLDDWIMVVFENLETNVMYEWIQRNIKIEEIEREFKEEYNASNPDDIKYINTKNTSIDLKDVIREEILIQCIE